MKYFASTPFANLVFSLVIVFFSITAFSQETGISPYSRLGLGDFNVFHSPAYQALGGASVSLADFNLVNTSNPATLSKLDQHMPVFELGGSSQFLTLNSQNSSADLAVTNFTRMSIALPVNKRLGVAIGLKPFSTTGYDITTTSEEGNSTNATFQYQGRGGINNVFVSGGYSLINKDSIQFSVGLTANVLFGNIEKSRRVEFPEDELALNSLLTQKTGYSGFDLQLGLLFNQKVTKNFSYSVGASFSLGTQLNATREDFVGTYAVIASTEVVRDTVSYFENNEGTVNVPSLLRLGASVLLYQNLEISAQYQQQDWTSFNETFEQPSSTDSLASASSFSFGLRFSPADPMSGAKYYQRIQYRAGLRMEQSHLQFNNTQLAEFGTSFGLGFPLRKSATSKNEFRSLSMLNVGVDFGSRGQTDNGLIRENSTTVYFGISIMPQVRNRWFVKRKFN